VKVKEVLENGLVRKAITTERRAHVRLTLRLSREEARPLMAFARNARRDSGLHSCGSHRGVERRPTLIAAYLLRIRIAPITAQRNSHANSWGSKWRRPLRVR